MQHCFHTTGSCIYTTAYHCILAIEHGGRTTGPPTRTVQCHSPVGPAHTAVCNHEPTFPPPSPLSGCSLPTQFLNPTSTSTSTSTPTPTFWLYICIILMYMPRPRSFNFTLLPQNQMQVPFGLGLRNGKGFIISREFKVASTPFSKKTCAYYYSYYYHFLQKIFSD